MATHEQVTELVEKMNVERARLVEQAAALDDEVAARLPVDKTGEEQWSVKEQLAHLCEMELNYDGWVRAALASDNPDVGGIAQPDAAIPIEQANRHFTRELLAVMATERRDTLVLIAGISPPDFDRTATHPLFGKLTIMQWLRSFYRHDRMHADQIAGREPEYRPKFTGAEPNQRLARLEKVHRAGGTLP